MLEDFKDIRNPKEKKMALVLLHNMNMQISMAKRQWLEIWKETAKLNDKQIERDTPKNMNINVRKEVNIRDIQSFLKKDMGNIVEAEWSEEKTVNETDDGENEPEMRTETEIKEGTDETGSGTDNNSD